MRKNYFIYLSSYIFNPTYLYVNENKMIQKLLIRFAFHTITVFYCLLDSSFAITDDVMWGWVWPSRTI